MSLSSAPFRVASAPPAESCDPASTADPLARLGPDIFVEVLYCLSAHDLLIAERVCRSWNDCAQAFSGGLWRRICLQEGIEPSDIKACDHLAQTGQWSVHEHDRRVIADNVDMLLTPQPLRDWVETTDTPLMTPLPSPGMGQVRVNWRYVCKTHKDLQAAWATSRCRLRWITTPNNVVWRIKSHMEQDVIMCTSRTSGFTVLDRNTSEPLFEISGLESYAHVEAERGFAVFNTPGHVHPVIGVHFDSDNENTAFEVWRTADARARSNLPYLGESSIAWSAGSYTHPDEYQPGVRNGPLPRGHMEHFRTLQPPKSCHALRLHIDGADTDDPRAVFGSAAFDEFYIWPLEENRPLEIIPRGNADKGRPRYIELDDEFVFICMETQMHVYSRRESKYIVSFPPSASPAQDAAALAFSLALSEDFKAIPDQERVRATPGATADGVPAPIGRANVTGALQGEQGFTEAILRGIAMNPDRVEVDEAVEIEYGFSAVHYTPTDLVCTARSGAVFVVRHYADVFNQALRMPEAERAQFVADNTIIIALGTVASQLTTYRHHIVICTSFNVIVIDGNSLPDIPDRNSSSEPYTPPTLRAHVLLDNHPQAMKQSSCIQADARSVYLTYWATGEMDAVGGFNASSATFPTNAALEGFGMCIKTWTFGQD